MGIILVMFLSPSLAQPEWPLFTASCEESHLAFVHAQPACPASEIVYVSHNGGGTDISFEAFLGQAGTLSNRTYIIRQSAEPYLWGCRQINIGGWSVSGKRECITIKGETGRREDVVFAGADPVLEPEYWHSSEYGGASDCGIGQHLAVANAEHIVLADFTMRNFPGKMIKIDGGNDAGTPWNPSDIRLHNLELHDCGSQMVKVAGDPVSSRDAVVECSYLHYTQALFPLSNYETQGVDVHEGQNWTIRDNLFENIRIGNHGNAFNGAAVIMWDRTDTVDIYRNLVLNCNSAFKLGASWYDDESNMMRAWNNLIIYNDADPEFAGGNVFELGQGTSAGGIFHNTIWNPDMDPGQALAVCSNGYRVENNLYVNGTTHRCDGLNSNLQIEGANWFRDVAGFDFRLAADRAVPQISFVSDDAAGRIRDEPVSAGAFEYFDDAKTVEPFSKSSRMSIYAQRTPGAPGETRLVVSVPSGFSEQADFPRISLMSAEGGRAAIHFRNARRSEAGREYVWDAEMAPNTVWFVRAEHGGRVVTRVIGL